MRQFYKMAYLILLLPALLFLGACSSEVGEDEDDIAPVLTLTSLNTGEEVVGTYNITWDAVEPNRSTVDIELSTDSGASFPHIVALNIPDTGSFSWDSNITPDCRNCRIRITAEDVVGNISEPVVSPVSFVVNNVPQVLGSALYFDLDNNGVDDGDQIIIPFDKPIELRTSVVGNVFILPVVADEIGPFSTMALGSEENELIITINDLVGSSFHLHQGGSFDSTKTTRTTPSGLDILENISGDIIFAKDTGRTAEPAGDGIDIAPTFGNETLVTGIPTLDTVAFAVGDLNADGANDVVALNTTAAGIYINNAVQPVPALVGNGQIPGSVNHTSVALGDVDGNGSLDVVVGNSVASLVYSNNGSASFSTIAQSASFNLNPSAAALVLGDVDGDEIPDLITASAGMCRVFTNNGSGVFTEIDSFSSTAVSSLALADIDGDTDLDILTGNDGQPNQVWTNTGVNSGSFTNSGQTLGNSNTRAVAADDIDGDGDMDLVTANFGQANRVWRNNGSGTFSEDTDAQLLGGISSTRSIVLMDVDEDGDPDIVTGNAEFEANTVYVNNGSGVYLGRQTLGAGPTFSVALGDIDGDGDLDILSGNNDDIGSGQDDVIYLNSQRIPGQQIFVDSNQVLGNENTFEQAAGDVDGDGDIDIVEAISGDGNKVWLNDGFNDFTDSGQSLGSGNTRAIALDDIDGDGDLDIISGNQNQANRVWRNDGTGNFTEDMTPQLLGVDSTQSLILGDVDGDGDKDLVEGNLGQPNQVWVNSGINSGTFVSPQALGNANTFGIVLGDVDGDTDLDIVAGNLAQASQVWLNGGVNSGVFSPDQSLPVANTTTVALGDIDGDGDMDLVQGNGFANLANQVRFNNGNASNMFGAAVTFGASDTSSVALGDIDRDGDLDIFSGNIIGQNNRLWLYNKAANTFSDSGEFLGSDDAQLITQVDIDGDGDPDLIVGNAGAPNQIFLNDY